MSDIRTTLIVANELGQPPRFDWAVQGPSLAEDIGLESAVLILLFTDRRARDDDSIPDGSGDRRGWWASPQLGSRLWLLEREKSLQSVVVRAREYCIEALQVLIDEGVADAIDVVTGWVEASGVITETRTATSFSHILGIGVTVHRPGTAPEIFRFQKFWEGAK